ncbi:MAG: PilW family protein [Candidatus Thiodiazotropha sp. (ex. Lucinisca nassula)]|nr:PilW family protein [Candidatus Thiodiazotropha sp. (ex. Lucinisca nassula)]MBW9275059.1 PilW family protein [Candidatus Thiodiazotropha sp. (ex. Lucinisca nassula)]
MPLSHQKQAGFSIISLMIASAIGLFLIGGAGKVYVDSKNAFSARSAIASATEKARFVIQDLRRTLIMAGRGIPQKDDDIAAYVNADNDMRTFPAVGTDGILNTDANGSSVIAMRYADGPAPCGQAGTLDGAFSTVRFYRDNEGILICETTTAGATVSQPLASDIVVMRALYGINLDEDDNTADQYLTADEVEDAGLWNFVIAIRIGFVTSSSDTELLPAVYRPAAPDELDILGMTYTAPDTTHFYQSASTTISLRNRNGVVQRQ